MTDFWKTAALVILTVILSAAISRTERDFSVVLTAVACCIASVTALRYLSEVLLFLRQLDPGGEYGNSFLEILLRITGVGLLTELICLISTDAGCSSLGKAMKILGNAVSLSMAVPVFEAFLSVVREMLQSL